MKYLVALFAALLVSSAAAQSNTWVYPSPFGIIVSVGKIIYDHDGNKEHLITVKASGSDEKEARTHGFQLAIEHVVGQLILSEREVRDNTVIRNDIIQYSSGYVSRYEVKEKAAAANGVVVIMDVWVKRSKIADRLVNHKPNSIDGRNLAVQMKTLQQQSTNGDRVLKTILNDYPARSFNVTYKDVHAERSGDRSIRMVIPITLTWSETYLKSVGEALVAINEAPQHSNRRNGYRLVSRLPGIIYSPTYDVWTPDFTRYTMFNETFTKVGVRVEIFDSAGNRMHEQCEEPQHSLTVFLNNQIILNGRAKLNHTMVVDGMSEEFVESMDKMTITAVKYCRQPMMAGR